MIHLLGLLIERELAGIGDYPYMEIMDLAGMVCIFGISNPDPRRG